MILLLPLSLVLLTCALRYHQSTSWRRAILFSYLSAGVWIALSTEFLSQAALLHSQSIQGVWAVFFVLSLAYCFHAKGKSQPASSSYTLWTHWSLIEQLLLGSIVLVVLAIGVTALYSAPNTVDSMNYHIARLIFWLQQGSVNFFATVMDPHNVYPPFSSYGFMHVYALSGNTDSYLNFQQYSAMIISLIGLSLIAYELGLKRLGVLLTLVFAATLPLGIIQSATTQNDYLASVWAIGCVYFLLRYKKSGGLVDLLAMAASLGLGLLTKGTNYTLLLPLVLVLWFGLRPLPRFNLMRLAIALLIVLLINGGFWLRLHTHNYIQKPPPQRILNEDFTPPSILSNLVRNATMHLSSPWPKVNAWTEQTIYQAASALKLDLNNPLNTRKPIENPFNIRILEISENTITNLLHFLLILFLLTFGLMSLKGREQFPWRVYVAGIILSWLVFNMMTKWQWWGNRFHLGWFLLLAPLFGLYFQSKKRIGFVLSLLLLGTSIGFITQCNMRPWFGPHSIFHSPWKDQFFRGTLAQKHYLFIARQIHNSSCKDIGLLVEPYVREYLFLRHIPHVTSYQFKYIFRDEPRPDFNPCLIVCSACPETFLNYNNHRYVKTTQGYLKIFKRRQ
jgi:4-amino-4-deoxy-L-arabinose transferase-like glycosyltransferase